MYSMFSQEILELWAWRLPFFLGGLLGIATFCFRMKQSENSINKRNKVNHDRNYTFNEIFKKKEFLSIISASLLCSILGTGIYIFAVYFPSVLSLYNPNIIRSKIIAICVVSYLIAFLTSILIGKIVDKIGFYFPILFSCLGFIIFSYSIFSLIFCNSFVHLLFGYLLFAILIGAISGSIIHPVIKSFNFNNRFSSCCISFSLAMSVFGGSAPLISIYLLNIYKFNEAPCILIIFSALISLITLCIKFPYTQREQRYAY